MQVTNVYEVHAIGSNINVGAVLDDGTGVRVILSASEVDSTASAAYFASVLAATQKHMQNVSSGELLTKTINDVAAAQAKVNALNVQALQTAQALQVVSDAVAQRQAQADALAKQIAQQQDAVTQLTAQAQAAVAEVPPAEPEAKAPAP